jgi:hypothetical protein
MRNLLAGLSALVILFGLLGWGRSWYTVATQPAEPGKFAFRVEFDPMKVGTDVTDAVRYLHSKVSKPKDESSESK